jgi:hypothetical protein
MNLGVAGWIIRGSWIGSCSSSACSNAFSFTLTLWGTETDNEAKTKKLPKKKKKKKKKRTQSNMHSLKHFLNSILQETRPSNHTSPTSTPLPTLSFLVLFAYLLHHCFHRWIIDELFYSFRSTWPRLPNRPNGTMVCLGQWPYVAQRFSLEDDNVLCGSQPWNIAWTDPLLFLFVFFPTPQHVEMVSHMKDITKVWQWRRSCECDTLSLSRF